MTPKAQRITIAEACGWSNIHQAENGTALMGWWHGEPRPSLVIPDYLSDLNAMHETEKVLTPLQWFDYSALLTKIVGPKDQEYYLNLHATAAQRAEAFLRTLNLYTA